MSCDGNRTKFFAHVCAPGSAAATAFGGPEEAQAALEQIFTTARSQPATDTNLPMLAEISTRALFAQMEQANIKRPTHAVSGLPKRDAQRGYHVVYLTLTALKKGQALPALARQVLEARAERRTVDARGLNAKGRLHCTSCGRFVKPQGDHLCPTNATPEALSRTLQRRLGVPAMAYPSAVMAKLIQQARHTSISMTHGVSGEEVEVTLDGLAQALAGGFSPDWFQQEQGFALAETTSGRIVPVFNSTGLQRVQRAPAAIGQAAQAYGHQMPAGTVPGTATALPSLPVHKIATLGSFTGVSGGTEYDLGHFIGTEYRRSDAQGTTVTVAGRTYTVGQRIAEKTAWGSARHSGIEPVPGATKKRPNPSNPTVGVGRTTFAAIGLLLDGEIVQTGDGRIQLYTAGRTRLLSVFDPATSTVGDTDGSTSASPEQVAAVLAHIALHPQNPSDAAFATDLVRVRDGSGEPLAAADGAYIALKNGLLDGATINFGGQVATQQCPACGQFMGDAHACPHSGTAQPAPPAPAPAAAAPPTPVVQPAQSASDSSSSTQSRSSAVVEPPVPGTATTPDVDTGAPTRLPAEANTPMIVQPKIDVQVAAPQVNVAAPQIDVAAPQIDVAAPQVNVAAPQVNVAAPQIDVAAPQIDVAAPQVTVEATIAAPQVTVEAKIDPAQIRPEVPPVNVTVEPKIEVAIPLNADDLTAAIVANLQAIAPAAATQAITGANFSEVGAAMRELAAALQASLGANQPLAPTPDGGRRVRGASEELTTGPRPAAEPEGPTGPRVRTAGKPIDPKRKKTGQEHILDRVILEAPDPFLSAVPRVVGGQLDRPLTERVPEVDDNFAINEQTEQILRSISSMLQMAQGVKDYAFSRAFGIYGPPGTGKNTTARQLAASIKTRDAAGNVTQGINYAEVNVTPETSLEEAIGTTILTTDPQSGATVSRVALGKIGLAAAMGSVICINEIVRNPKLATALQSMLEDREIHVNSPETGDLIKVPVHPSTIFVLTWNPGNEGDPDRPAQAPLERILPLHLGAPSTKEQESRIDAFFAQFGIPDTGSTNATADLERRRKQILAKDYKIPTGQAVVPSAAEKAATVRFFAELTQLASGFGGGRKLGLNSDTPTAPGPRRMMRFVALGKTQGWLSALESLKICCDQDDTYDEQWRLVRETFVRFYGDDGNALGRVAPAQN